MKKKWRIYAILSLMTLVTSCSKDDDGLGFTNLSATITNENDIVGTTEGDYVYINLNLDKALSEDLRLKASFSSEGIASYINDEDYSKSLEYSIDNTKWNKGGKEGEVLFPKGNSNLKIRLKTIDDKLMEATEEFELTLKGEADKKLKVTENLNPITISVKDNDVERRPQDKGVLAEISIKDDYSGYSIESMVERIDSRLAKKILDSKYKKAMDDLLKMYKLLPNDVKVIQFDLIADPDSGLGGYVYNAGQQDGTDEWVMGMNLGFAFYDTQNRKEMEYNANGEYGNILTHEMGHILTLNYKEQLNPLKDGENCQTYQNVEGCAKPDAYVHHFDQQFYVTPTVNEPTHVSTYAKTNLEEDIAEPWAQYATQMDIPAANAQSSGALQKMNFIKNQSFLGELKPKIREIVKLGYLNSGTNILAKQIDKDGKRISCLNHKAALQLLNKKE